jgi:hypothetical protein
MSKAIKMELQSSLRQQVIQATKEAAKDDNVSVHADALALVSQPHLLCVNAPIAGIETLDFKALLDGDPVLDDTPVMYWHLSGDGFFEAKGSIPAGFYTVVAHQNRGAVSLRDAHGKTVAGGDLTVVIQTPPTVVEKTKPTGVITSVKFGHNSMKVCGEASVSVLTASITITACVTVKW